MNGGPSHVDTFDPKPALAEVRRQAAADRQPGDGAADRRGAAVAVQVSQVWPERHRSERAVFERGPLDRRHCGDPLDACRRAEPRTVAAADELRRCAADSAEPGFVAVLWSGHRESESAGVRGDVPDRLSDSGDAELAVRFSAGRLRGVVHRLAAHRVRSADRAHSQRAHAGCRSNASNSICSRR